MSTTMQTTQPTTESIAHTLTLTGALLGAWTYEATELGERYLQDALRMDTQRCRAGLPSVGITLNAYPEYAPHLSDR